MATKGKRGASSKLLTRLQLAKELNYNPRTIQKFEEEGLRVAVRGRGGRPSQYDKAEVQKWIAARNKKAEKAAAGNGKLNLFEERAEKERWQGLLSQQTYLTRQRELLPRIEVEKAWAAEVTGVRTKLLAWATTLADRVHRVSTLEGLAGVERVLQDAVRDVLVELSNPQESEPPAKSRKRKSRAA